MVSLPIPSMGLPYSKIQVTPTQTYADLMRELAINTLRNAKVGHIKYPRLPLEQAEAHFDPDLDPSRRARLPGWRPMFGQVGAPQSTSEIRASAGATFSCFSEGSAPLAA